MFRLFSRAALALYASLFAIPVLPAFAEDEAAPRDLATIKESGELRVAADPSSGQPYFAQGANGPIGFEAEIATAIAHKMGIKPVFVPIPWRDLRDAVMDGRADVAINALEIKDDELVRFTVPYYVASQAILVRGSDTRIYQLADLGGRKVATTEGSVAAAILDSIRPAVKATLADDTEAPFRLLRAGTVEAVMLEAAMVRGWLKREPKGYRLAGRPVLPRPYGVAVRRSNPQLLGELDGALAKLKTSGEHGKILRSHGLWDSLQGSKVANASVANPATKASPGASPKPTIAKVPSTPVLRPPANKPSPRPSALRTKPLKPTPTPRATKPVAKTPIKPATPAPAVRERYGRLRRPVASPSPVPLVLLAATNAATPAPRRLTRAQRRALARARAAARARKLQPVPKPSVIGTFPAVTPGAKPNQPVPTRHKPTLPVAPVPPVSKPVVPVLPAEKSEVPSAPVVPVPKPAQPTVPPEPATPVSAP